MEDLKECSTAWLRSERARIDAELTERAGADGEGATPIHDHFGLSYASFLVLPRVLLQSMPVGWQRRLVDLIGEYGTAVEKAGLDVPDSYRVTPTNDAGKFVSLDLPHYRHAPNLLTPRAAEPAHVDQPRGG